MPTPASHDYHTYLGDGLYAKFDGFQIELYASNGITVSNRVFLDDTTTAAFLRWLDRLKKEGAL